VARAAARAGVQMDPRTIADVVADLRKAGVPAQPFFRLVNQPTSVMPLGNSPHRMIVFCNELGRYMIFQADRHGFNNPDHVWDEPAIELALLGDSFVQGACEPDNRNFANLLRGGTPSLLNLGIGANNPQLNLATLVEYAVPSRARNAIWFHYAGNDLAGMAAYRNHRLLRRYVEEDFSQGLFRREHEVETAMHDFHDQHASELSRKAEPQATLPTLGWRHVLRLANLRHRIGLSGGPDPTPDYDYFAAIVRKARAAADAAGIRLAFVILPNELQLHDTEASSEVAKTAAVLRASGLPVFDLTPVFQTAGEESVYAFGQDGGHLSSQGNVVVAEFVRDQVLPALAAGRPGTDG